MSKDFDVDLVLGDAAVAIEVKSADRPMSDYLKGLRAWKEEHPRCCSRLVSRVPRPSRTEKGIEVLPWADFLLRL